MKFFILKKYLSFDRTQPFISIAAILAVLGIAVGVMVLLVAMAIMNGMGKEFRRQLFVMNHSINIISTQKNALNFGTLQDLRRDFPTLDFSPYLREQSVVRHEGALHSILIFGVNFEDEAVQNDVLNSALKTTVDPKILQNPFPIVLGTDLYENLFAQNGDKISLLFTRTEPAGITLSPISKRFNLSGFFHSGIRAYDLAYAFTTIDSLQAIRGENAGFDGIFVRSKNPKTDIKILKTALKNVVLEGFWSENEALFSALEIEKRALFIVLMLIILMASLNIVSSLLMAIMSRRKEIALLLAFGASRREILKIFFTLGVIIGGAGVVLGVMLAGFAGFALTNFDIITLPKEVYGISKLPLDLSVLDFCAVMVGACVIVAVSSVYPAQKAAKINVLSVLRNE